MLNKHPDFLLLVVVRQSRQTLVIKFADQLELEKARSLSCLLPSGAVGHIPGTPGISVSGLPASLMREPEAAGGTCHLQSEPRI